MPDTPEPSYKDAEVSFKLFASPSGKPLTDLSEAELIEWQSDLTERVNKLTVRRSELEKLDPQDRDIGPNEHWAGERNIVAIHELTKDISVIGSAIVAIMSRLAEIEFRRDMRKQNRRMEGYTVAVGLMVLTQLLLSCGVIGGKSDGQAEMDSTSKPQVESPAAEAPSESS